MKNIGRLGGGFGIISALVEVIREAINSYKEVTLSSSESNKDLEAILSNSKDRAKYNEVVRRLKENRLKENGEKSEEVEFSDRTITIFIE